MARSMITLLLIACFQVQHSERINVELEEKQMRNIIVIMAPPAGGKGTQAKKIMSLLNIAHLSTGDMLRHEVKKGTPVGLEAGAVMASGGLVKDELVIEIIRR